MAELQDISGIGPATAALLGDHGLTSVKKLAKADLAAITAVPGFGPTRARAVQAAARAALPAKTPRAAGRPEPPSGSMAPESVARPEGAERSTSKGGKKKSSKDAKNKKKASKKKKKAKKG